MELLSMILLYTKFKKKSVCVDTIFQRMIPGWWLI